MKIVLQKFIADSGFCSRRQAEDLIRCGKVFVNDKKAELGMKASEEDEVEIDKRKISLVEEKIYIKLNKPIGYTCTNRKFANEKNVFDLVKVKQRLFVVGRLDKDSRGLVVLTNDGDWSNKITHPRYGHKKKYEVVVSDKNLGEKSREIVSLLKRGVDIGRGDGIARAKEIEYLGDGKFELILAEGKNRQIRRMFGSAGLSVIDLQRIEIGRLKLGELKIGQWKFLTKEEIIKL